MPGTHPQSAHAERGTVYANYAVDQSDLLLAFGVRFDDRVTGKLEEFAKHGKIVHIDHRRRDPQEQRSTRFDSCGCQKLWWHSTPL
ncbi:MAG: hypothetical protein U0936_22510 [Planctomycetaceae bacterium]